MARRLMRILTAPIRWLQGMDDWIATSLGRGIGAVIQRLGLRGRVAIAVAIVAGLILGFVIYGVAR